MGEFPPSTLHAVSFLSTTTTIIVITITITIIIIIIIVTIIIIIIHRFYIAPIYM